MNNANAQVISLYKQGLSAGEIAEELDYDVVAVKAIIGGTKGKERGKREEDKITDQDEQELIGAMKQIAFQGENESARVKAAIYLIEEKNGRNAARVKGGRPQMNITMINQAILNSVQRVNEKFASQGLGQMSRGELVEGLKGALVDV